MKRLYSLLALLFLLFGTAAHASRDDVLVLVNDNSKDSPQIGEYYAEQRNINPANVVHLRVRDGNYLTWTEFRRMRDQIIRFMQQNTLDEPGLTPVTCADGDGPYYCQASMDQVRQHTKIRYIVTTRGIPARTTVDGSTLLYNGPTSVDNYLKYWLINYYEQDVSLSSSARAAAFADGRGMRTVDPRQDAELIVGRIDGINLASAKALVDRALEVERNGWYGKLYGSKYGKYSGQATWKDYSMPNREYVYGTSATGWRYQLGLLGESRPECIDYLESHYSKEAGKAPQHCLVRLTDGNDPAQGVSNSRAPLADEALAYLGSLDGQTTGAGDFNNLLNWRRDTSCSVTLCENATDPATCRAASGDPFGEINTECVGVGDGFIGYNYQSYPVAVMAVWPTGWQTFGGDTNNLAFPEVRSDSGYDDSYSLWFRNADQVANPLCYGSSDFSTLPTQACLDARRVQFFQDIRFTPKTVNTANPQQYRISFRYKTEDLTKTAALRVNLQVHETGVSSNTFVNYGLVSIATPPLGSNEWAYGEATVTLDPTLHTNTDLSYDQLRVVIDTNSTVIGALGLDTVSIQEVGAGTELAMNASFNQGHKQVSSGDHAANYLGRLNGVAFWGSVSHHQSGGHSFSNHPMETLLYLMRGLPLGDAVWFMEYFNSGVLYGDPLYSPMAIGFDYLSNPGDRIVGATQFTGKTRNGNDPARVSTDYQVDYCAGSDFFVCDQQQSWTSTGMSGAGGQMGQTLGIWDPTNLPVGDYTLRLAVTSDNSVIDKTQTFYDYYPIKNRYANSEIPLYRISGFIKEPDGQPVAGVSLAINDNYGYTSTVTTDANGYYHSGDLKSGTYIVYPTKTGYTIQPTSGNIFQSIGTAHATKDFTATRGGYSITGTVKDTAGQPLAGVQVQFSGPNGFAALATTNAAGNYAQGGLSNGTYTLAATLPGYTVTPDGGSAIQAVSGGNAIKGFTASVTGGVVSGTIIDEKGQPMAGVQVAVNDNYGYSAVAVTNTNGYYQKGNLSNGIYVAVPSFDGYSFSVNNGAVFFSIDGNSITGKDFTGTPVVRTYSISGFIMENGQPVPGVSVAINDNYGFTSSVTTDNSGYYYKNGLKNGLYLVYPTRSGYTFQVTQGNLFQSINDSNVIAKDFTATHN